MAPINGISIVQGEIAYLVSHLRRDLRHSKHTHDDQVHMENLFEDFAALKDALNAVENLSDLDAETFLSPFLEVITAKATMGRVTGLAVTSINKFLSYELINESTPSLTGVIEMIGVAVTHANFHGTDPGSNEAVLARILQVLRTLLVIPVGAHLSNATVYEIFKSCLHLCFEREDRQQDSCCIEIEDPAPKATAELSAADQSEAAEEAAEFSATLAASSRDRTVSLTEPAGQDQVDAAEESIVAAPEASPSVDVAEQPAATIVETEAETEAEAEAEESGVLQPLLAEKSEQPGDQPAKDYVNPKGIRFTAESSDAETAAPQSEDVSNAAAGAAGPAASSTLGVANTKRQLGPYGLLSVREIFKQLIANMNPHDRSNTDAKMETCLNLLAQAFEVAADSLEKCDCLLELVRSDLCKNLVSLLHFSGTSVFAASLRLGYLIFSSLRWHLKFQLERYLTRLMEIVTSEGSRVSFDHRELALESLVQLWRVPGFVAEELARRRERKKLLQQGAELFNRNPAKGLAFLGEHKLLYPNCPESVAAFLRENPSLDKKVLGEFISKKKLAPILRAFCRSFNFAGRRVDEALRDYLETFRLPGEAPLIQHVLEHFADHWHSANGHPFANEDAAYVLAYSVIMLNTDQHNANARKQNLPMTLDNFKRNLKGVNGGKDFDQDMLEAIYMTIKNDEIVMPSEQTGLVKENYMWKLILRRGSTEQASFIRAPVGQLDLDLFNLIWGPTVAALSHVFDKTADEAIVVPKAISGFRKCAMISAHYGLTDVFDNIIISLCKFTGLLSSVESPDNIAVQFGGNIKAQLAAKTVCGLTHRHGDILREGWKNLLDCMLHLYKARLMPDSLVEVKDFIHPSGKIRLIKEETTNTNRQETGVFSSLYMSLFSDTSSSRAALSEELAARQRAAECIRECQLEQLVQDTKFLRMDSLSELVKDLIFAVQDNYQSRDLLSDGHSYAVLDEDACVFYFELLMQVLLQNRDRLGPLWSSVRSYFYNVLIGSTESSFLLERSIVGLIRLGHRLLHREDMSAQVFSCLRLLILAKPSILHSVCRQVVYGLHDLINTHAQSVHSEADWRILFALLEVCGAGALPSLVYRAEVASSLPEGFGPAAQQQQIGVEADLASSDGRASPASTNADRPSGRGYTSDSELYDANKRVGSGGGSGGDRDVRMDPSTGSWVLVDRDMSASAQDVSGPASSAGSSAGATAAAAAATVAAGTGGYDGQRSDSSPLVHQVMQNCPPVNQYSIALQEDLRHHDTKALVRACETLSFVIRDSAHVTPANFESCIHALRVFIEASLHGGRSRRRSFRSQLHQRMQLLDLMHTLHIRVATIFKSWSPQEKSSDCSVSCAYLWDTCWCPLLQGMARLCCDNRKPVRMQALTYLQRSLLFHDLRSLTPGQWEMCFNKVLFPLLSTLLEAPVNPSDPAGTEETRVRASTLLCKVFLMHLSPLLNLPTFTALWLTILDFMEKYIRADKSELLIEAIPESLKNMLLVMDNACILRQSRLWDLTWHRIGAFLPSLMEELFPQPKEAVA
uniref:SEC7 domain-containing protein n=1 Tax=Macrostomum lignano TaxID=282301 RepID=A0A1I8JDI8_9PLAT